MAEQIQIDEDFLKTLLEKGGENAKIIAAEELENIKIARNIEVAAEQQQQAFARQERAADRITAAELIKSQEQKKKKFREAANTYATQTYTPQSSMSFGGAAGILGGTAARLGGNIFSIMFPTLARVVSTISSAAQESYDQYKDQEKKTRILNRKLTDVDNKLDVLVDINNKLEDISDKLSSGKFEGGTASSGSSLLDGLLTVLGIKGGLDFLKKLTSKKIPRVESPKTSASEKLSERALEEKAARNRLIEPELADAVKTGGTAIESAATATESLAEKTAKGLTGASRVASKIATPLAVGVEGYEGYRKWAEANEALAKGQISEDEANKRKVQAVTGTGGAVVGMFGGAYAGAGVGAAIGTFGGPVGTAVGGIVGGIIGGIGGAWAGRGAAEDLGAAGKSIYDSYNKPSEQKPQDNNQPSSNLIHKNSYGGASEDILYQSLSYDAKNLLFNVKDFFIISKSGTGFGNKQQQQKSTSKNGIEKASYTEGAEENAPSQAIKQLSTNYADSAQEASPSMLSGLITGGGVGTQSSAGFGGMGFGGGSDPTAAANLETIKTKNGKSTKVAKEFASAFQGFINDLEATGYQINSLGGYDRRPNVNNPAVMSYHASGAAIDINPESNPNGSRKTDMPENVREIAAKWGLGWGMDFKSTPDPMHFSAAKSEYGSADISRLGSTQSFANRPMAPEAQMQFYNKSVGQMLNDQAVTNEAKQKNSSLSTITNQQSAYNDFTSQSNKSPSADGYSSARDNLNNKFIEPEIRVG